MKLHVLLRYVATLLYRSLFHLDPSPPHRAGIVLVKGSSRRLLLLYDIVSSVQDTVGIPRKQVSNNAIVGLYACTELKCSNQDTIVSR